MAQCGVGAIVDGVVGAIEWLIFGGCVGGNVGGCVDEIGGLYVGSIVRYSIKCWGICRFNSS